MKTDFVILQQYLEPLEAHILKGRLEAEGIVSFLGDENLTAMNPFYGQAIGGVKLKVRAQDAQKASEILAINNLFSAEDYFPETPESGPTCPVCGDSAGYKTNVSALSKFLFAFSAIFFVPLPFFQTKLKCANCGAEWKAETKKNSLKFR